MDPEASIIIPAFNAADSVAFSLRSALNQTLLEIEVVLVDDGSTDATRSLAAAIASQDSRLTVLAHPLSKGPSAARNTAVAAARGKWIVLLDADDSMATDRVEKMVAEAQARKLDALADNLELVDSSSGNRIGVAFDPGLMAHSHLMSLDELLSADWPGRNRNYRSLGVAKPILRRAFLKEHNLRYDPTVRLGEDLLFYSALLVKGARFGLTPAAQYFYRTNTTSISTRRKPTTELIDVNSKILAVCHACGMRPPSPLLDQLDEREAALRFQVLTWSVRSGSIILAARMARAIGLAKLARLLWTKMRQTVPIALSHKRP